MNLINFTLFPSKGNRKLSGFYSISVLYVLGCLATNVQVDGYTFVALFGIFAGANYGEHRNGKKT
jgi:hypothetical protein